MKTVAFFVLLVAINMVCSEPLRDYRGCQYIQGICVRECEEGTRAYVRDCDYVTPEATCDNPNPEIDLKGKICDYSQCYCEEPTVRDPITNKCVKLEDCTKFE